MSEEKKPTAPEANDGAMPIACTTVRVTPATTRTGGAKTGSGDAEDAERTVIPVIPPRAD